MIENSIKFNNGERAPDQVVGEREKATFMYETFKGLFLAMLFMLFEVRAKHH